VEAQVGAGRVMVVAAAARGTRGCVGLQQVDTGVADDRLMFVEALASV